MKELVDSLKDKNKPDRWQYVIALEKVGEPAVEYLIQALKDDDKWVRFLAVDALGHIGDGCCVEPLIGMLKDADQDVRFASAEALGRLGNPKALPALEETCVGDNCFVKIAAEESVASLKNK